MKDPQRWVEDPSSPKGTDALVRALEEAPPLDEVTRARVRNQLLHATAVVVPPRMAWRAPVLGATAVVLAGILLWRFQPSDGVPEVELRPEVAAAVDRVVEEPAAAVQPSRVFVTSEPTGATIYVDGEMRGTAPLQLDLPPGTHDFEAELDGYASARVTIVASAGEQVSVALALGETARPIARTSMERETRMRTEARSQMREPSSELGYLVINTMPWSRVYIDGQLVGTTPIGRHRIAAGSHRVRLRTAEGHERVITVDVRAGQTSRVVVRLDRPPTMTGELVNPF